MRILVASPRAPDLHGKGDQLRLAQQLPRLCRSDEVVLVYPEAQGDERPAPLPGLTLRPVRLGRRSRVLGTARALLCHEPAQVGWFAPTALRRAIRSAAREADLVLFVTSRCVVPVTAPSVVDHIDALSLNADRRGTGRRLGALSWLWSQEAARLRRWEASCAAGAAVQIVTSPEDARHLPPRPAPVVVPNGVHLDHATAAGRGARDVDVVFTGTMTYPPNRMAARWIADEIGPAIRRRRPDCRIVIVGRAASTLPPVAGVEVHSDVPDLRQWLLRSKVALAPLTSGTGIPNKVLEAAAAGAAIVMTPEANHAFGFDDIVTGIGESAEQLAERVVRLLEDDDARAAQVAAMHREVTRFEVSAVAEAFYDAAVARGAGSAAPPEPRGGGDARGG